MFHLDRLSVPYIYKGNEMQRIFFLDITVWASKTSAWVFIFYFCAGGKNVPLLLNHTDYTKLYIILCFHINFDECLVCCRLRLSTYTYHKLCWTYLAFLLSMKLLQIYLPWLLYIFRKFFIYQDFNKSAYHKLLVPIFISIKWNDVLGSLLIKYLYIFASY